MPLVWPDGPQMSLFGQAPAPVSPLAQLASAAAQPTNGTSGLKCSGSLTSAALQSSLESRLRQRMAAYGSPEYALTWKHWDMPSGVPICALRASAHRTSDSGFTGWPTPNAMPPSRGGLQANPQKALERRQLGHMMNLDDTATLAGWPTPDTGSAGGRMSADPMAKKRPSGTKKQITLNDTARLADWATPTAQPANSTPANFLRRKKESMERGSQSMGLSISDLNMQVQAWAPGDGMTYSLALTAKRGVLNPAHSRWLQGYPPLWDASAPMVARSSRKSRRSS